MKILGDLTHTKTAVGKSRQSVIKIISDAYKIKSTDTTNDHYFILIRIQDIEYGNSFWIRPFKITLDVVFSNTYEIKDFEPESVKLFTQTPFTINAGVLSIPIVYPKGRLKFTNQTKFDKTRDMIKWELNGIWDGVNLSSVMKQRADFLFEIMVPTGTVPIIKSNVSGEWWKISRNFLKCVFFCTETATSTIK